MTLEKLQHKLNAARRAYVSKVGSQPLLFVDTSRRAFYVNILDSNGQSTAPAQKLERHMLQYLRSFEFINRSRPVLHILPESVVLYVGAGLNPDGGWKTLGRAALRAIAAIIHGDRYTRKQTRDNVTTHCRTCHRFREIDKLEYCSGCGCGVGAGSFLTSKAAYRGGCPRGLF